MPGKLGINFIYRSEVKAVSESCSMHLALVSEMLEVDYLLLRGISCSVAKDWPV